LLGGQHLEDDEAALHAARLMFGDSFPKADITVGAFTGSVQWVALLLHQETEDEDAPPERLALGFLAILPIFCELCGIE